MEGSAPPITTSSAWTLSQLCDQAGLTAPSSDATASRKLTAFTDDSRRVVPGGCFIAVRGHQVEHWLNGERVVAYELSSPEWKRLVATSKYKDVPAYGKAKRGHLGLQNYGTRRHLIPASFLC